MRNPAGAVFLALAVATSAQAQHREALDSVFAAYDRTDGPGCAVAVSRNGQVLAARGFGMSDLAQSLAAGGAGMENLAQEGPERQPQGKDALPAVRPESAKSLRL